MNGFAIAPRKWLAQHTGLVWLIAGTLAAALLSYMVANSRLLTPYSVISHLVETAEETISTHVRSETGRDLLPTTRQSIRFLIAERLEQFENRSLLHKALEHLALALFVAAFLIASIEAYTRRKALKEIGEEVLQSVFAKIIPLKVFESVRDHVLLARVIRRNYTYTMDLHEPPPGVPNAADHVIATTTHHFWLHNLTGQSGQTFALALALNPDPTWTVPSVGKYPAFLQLTVDGKEIPAADAFKNDGMVLRYDVDLPETELTGVEVFIRTREVGRRPTETGTWTLSTLIEGLTVQMSSDVPNLECEAQLHHAEGMNFRKVRENVWRFGGVLLPGHGWEIRTRIRAEQTPAPVPDPGGPGSPNSASA